MLVCSESHTNRKTTLCWQDGEFLMLNCRYTTQTRIFDELIEILFHKDMFNKLSKGTMLLGCIWKVPSSNLGLTPILK